MKRFDVSAIPIGTCFSDKVYLDKNYIVLAPHEPVSVNLLERLSEWGYKSVVTNGTHESALAVANMTAADTTVTDAIVADKPESTPHARKAGSIQYYFDLIDSTQMLIDRFRDGAGLDKPSISRGMATCLEIVRAIGEEILRYPEYPFPIQDYLAVHMANCAIMTAAIGGYFSREESHLQELVEAAYLHDIGMAALPAQIYEKEDTLSPEELERIRSHPALGYQALKEASYSEEICLVALEHHEWLDGTGYPGGKTGSEISPFAQVVAVLCSYDAATSSRPYKEAVDSHAAISDMLRNGGKRYHTSVIKAFAHMTAAYAPGSFVRLSNGAAGLVIRANEGYPTMPTVRLLFDEHGEKVNTHRVVQTHSENGISVDHEIGPDELSYYY